MQDEVIVQRIQANPKYQELRRKRGRLGWSLTVVMLVVYYGYIALIAFDKAFLAKPLGDGVSTLGIPMGLGLILFTIVITALYIRKANGEYDRLTREILEEAQR
ncbi:hypothetical protein CCO03_14390 [Comamonas serinivorans]|uniref:DUF485 domain-containing protein n=1 Tax=Comamonas serinivorans TaxID=1082851 RepID=A0A1Y0EPY3_9BURK|nr:DUF485 domain-containing protein [Comamonas serinivorans]ARU05714.1 hypothetical protein CCO03_14390 [Comamonas serinivorans]